MQWKRFHRLIFAVYFILVCAPAIEAADLAAQLTEFRAFAARQMKEDQIPGMTIGFIRWGDGADQTWIEGFGYSDLENQVTAKPETGYRLGSVSKPLTAVAVLLLAERGKINLDAEVQTYVPYFPKKKWPITVRQLLGHLGGISHYKNYDVEGRIKEHKNTREALAIFDQWDLVAEPGTKYVYSSYGYNLLAAVVEGASGMPFGEFMKQNVWLPLGMKDTRLDDPADLIPNRARGYRLIEGRIKNSEFVDMSSRLGAGGTRSTVSDLLKFAKGITTGRILAEGSLDLVYVSMTTRDGRFTDYSAGWDTRPVNGHFLLRHTGSQQETRTALFCFPALKLAIACAVNQEDAGATIFARRLFELLTNETWALAAYVTARKNDYTAIDSVFASGLSYFELREQPFTLVPQELEKSFDYFRKTITTSANADELIADGPDTVSGQAYTKMGSYMAKTLSDEVGHDRFQQYHASGPIAFFDDYMKICDHQRSKERTCVFPKEFHKLISEWNKSWNRTSTEETRKLSFHLESDPETIGKPMQSFRSASAFPDYSREISDLTWNLLTKGEVEKSLQTGEIGIRYYPESARMLALYGICLVAVSDRTRGIAYLKKAYQLDPKSPAEPSWLSDFAEELANFGKIEQAMKVLQAAVELYPKNPGLLSDMGEAYLAVKDTQKAKEYFEKALALDPTLERAKTLLEKTK